VGRGGVAVRGTTSGAWFVCLLVCLVVCQLLATSYLYGWVHRVHPNNEPPAGRPAVVDLAPAAALESGESLVAELVVCAGPSPFVFIGATSPDSTGLLGPAPSACHSLTAEAPRQIFIGVWARQWSAVEQALPDCGLRAAVQHGLHTARESAVVEWAALTRATDPPSANDTPPAVVLLFLYRRPEFVWMRAPVHTASVLFVLCRSGVSPLADSGDDPSGIITSTVTAANGLLLFQPAFTDAAKRRRLLKGGAAISILEPVWHGATLGTFLPCAVATPRDTTSNPFAKHVMAMLTAVKEALAAVQVDWWINSGTLLGWLRECDVMAHARDVDIGVFADRITESTLRDLIAALSVLGLRLSHRFGVLSDSFELSFDQKFPDGTVIKLDIFFFYRDQRLGVVWNGGTQARSGRRFKYSFPVVAICWAELRGLRVPVPCGAEQHVAANYGAAWRTPVTVWDWKSSPPNVVPNGRWAQSQWPATIQCDVCQFKIDMSTPFDAQLDPEYPKNA
jgi:hypothetical protein